MRLIGFYNYTVVLTYISLISSLVGMRFAYVGKIGLAIACLAFSGFCDMFDGVVARTKKNRTNDEKNFGIQLDSLCDVVCFGVLPAVILYFCGVNTVYGIAILVFYALCAVIRLAFFNVLETKRQMTESGCAKEYRGLPVTSSAIIFPAAYLLSLAVPSNVMIVLYYVLPFLTAAMFITDIRIPKLDIGKLLRKKAPKDKAEEEEKENVNA